MARIYENSGRCYQQWVTNQSEAGRAASDYDQYSKALVCLDSLISHDLAPGTNLAVVYLPSRQI